MARTCNVCLSPHRNSIDYFLLSKSKSHPTLAAEFGLSRDSIARHSRGNHANRQASALANISAAQPPTAGTGSAAGTSTPPALPPAIADGMRTVAAQQQALVKRAESLLDDAEGMLAKFKDSAQARDVKMSIDAVAQSIRLIADLSGAMPKPQSGTTIDNRQIVLAGLSTDDLKALAESLRRPALPHAIDAEYTEQ